MSKEKESLTAVILADSFDEYYRPVTLERPRTLFPLVGTPVLDYTIEFLSTNNVSSIYVYCCSLSEKIDEYLKNSHWRKRKHLTINVIVNNESKCAGDALRYLYETGIFREDFILVNGDLLSNINLTAVMKGHFERRKKDREAIMTVVLKEALVGHQTRSKKESVIVSYDAKSNQLLHFSKDAHENSVSFSFDTFESFEYNDFQIRYDVLDCALAICNPEVLFQFSENFDYRRIDQIITGIIREEILSAKVHCHFVERGEYAARVDCLRTYKAVLHDVINRWTYPMVPDNNITGNTYYLLNRYSIYKEKNVTLSRSSVVRRETSIGMGTSVGGKSKISHSVIGRGCVIGINVTLNGCIIWDGVTIGDDVTITDSLICDNVVIHKASIIEKGCVLSFNTVVGSGSHIEPFTRLTTFDSIQNEPIDLGENGNGERWTSELEIERGTELVNTVKDKELELLDDDDSDSDRADVDTEQFYISSRENFLSEMYDCISMAMDDDRGPEQTGQDLRTLKYAYVVTFLELAEGMIIAIFNIAFLENPDDMMKAINTLLNYWKSLFVEYLSIDAGDQLEFIYRVQEFCHDKESFLDILGDILKTLYDKGIVNTAAVQQWANDQEDAQGDEIVYFEISKQLLANLDKSDSYSFDIDGDSFDIDRFSFDENESIDIDSASFDDDIW